MKRALLDAEIARLEQTPARDAQPVRPAVQGMHGGARQAPGGSHRTHEARFSFSQTEPKGRVMSEWDFWYAQLAGETPETTPGTPHAGYYMTRRRETYDNPKPTVGGPRKKVKNFEEPAAIWKEDSGWQCVITREDRTIHLTDVDQIDALFSRCCRTPITYEKYLELTKREDAA